MTIRLLQGDCRAVLASLPAESVHCVVTSPPYYGLRDYGTAQWSGGDAECDHGWSDQGVTSQRQGRTYEQGHPHKQRCSCGAERIDSQLGLEPTPQAYIANMVEVFREVRRVLRKDGTLWLNIGDSYAGSGKGPAGENGFQHAEERQGFVGGRNSSLPGRGGASVVLPKSSGVKPPPGLKAKDLIGIPWMLAFALREPYYTGAIADERDRCWLAALMDGEGTFTILSTASPHGSGNSYPPIAQVRMTSPGVIRKAASLVGVMSPAQYPPSRGGKRAIYQWRLAGSRAADVARELYPYLIEKRTQALIVWNHQAVRDGYETKRGVTIPSAALEKQLVCRELIRRLNRGESIDIPSWMVEPPALFEPGWYLRSDCIWSKPNPMPESVTDRPTKAHEYLFLLTKSARYFYDADAIREEPYLGNGGWAFYAKRGDAGTDSRPRHTDTGQPRTGTNSGLGAGVQRNFSGGRNKRSVWEVATEPFPEAHFATYPTALVEPCIKAGTSEKGCCPDCGAPWVRVVGREPFSMRPNSGALRGHSPAMRASSSPQRASMHVSMETTGWAPSCEHPGEPQPCTVLDPFAGAGTTLLVADRLQRNAIGIELSAEYVALARRRLTGDAPMFVDMADG